MPADPSPAAPSAAAPAIETPRAPAQPPPAPRPLLPAPLTLVANGAPLAGTWAGSVVDASFAGLRPPCAQGLRRLLVEKKWVYALAAAPDVFVCLGIVDVGYLHSGFLGVFDRRGRKLLADAHPVLPPLFASIADDPGPGLAARLWAPGARAEIVRVGPTVRVSAGLGGATVELLLDARDALPPLSACAPLGEGLFDFTQKTVLLRAVGEVRAAGRTFHLEGAPAGLDFTHGLLRRQTAWRWAFGLGEAGGRRVALNFSEGFVGEGGPENVVWVDGAPTLVGPVAFSFDPKDPAAPWSLRSPGGGVELEFAPEGRRAQDIDALGLVISRYSQPFGTFRGHLTAPGGERVAIEGLAGVTEDHTAVW